MASDLDTFPRFAHFRAWEAQHLYEEDRFQIEDVVNEDWGAQGRVDVDLQQFVTYFLTFKTFLAAMWYNSVLYLAAVGIAHVIRNL